MSLFLSCFNKLEGLFMFQYSDITLENSVKLFIEMFLLEKEEWTLNVTTSSSKVSNMSSPLCGRLAPFARHKLCWYA